MPSSSTASHLDSPPDAETIAELRTQASAQDKSAEVTFLTAGDDTKRFVVSPRGTCVVLGNTREDSFNPSVTAEEVATSLRGTPADA
jgi:hypothetical protein